MEREEIEYIYNLRRFGMKLDLSIMREFAEIRGNPQDNFKSVHIAGTNGKGSVASAIYSILRRIYNVGIYTSPHLVRYSERIIVNDEEISEDYIARFVQEVKPIIKELAKENRNPTFFEVSTMLAFEYFASMNVDFAVLEVGLGGRLDATNIVTPEITSIVTIDLDHTHILGDTIRDIAREKAGIIKPNVPVVVGERKKDAVKEIKRIANLRNAPYHNIWEETEFEDIRIDLNGLRFKAHTPISSYNISTPLPGKHQITNMLVAIRMAELLQENYTISHSDIEEGIKNIRWKDRFQVKRREPLLIFDSAHNPSAAKALVSTIKDVGIKEPTFLFSILSDKNIDGFLEEIAKVSKKIIVTEIGYERRRTELKDIEMHAKKYFPQVVSIKNSCDALKYAIENEKRIIATGSIYLLGELEKCLMSL